MSIFKDEDTRALKLVSCLPGLGKVMLNLLLCIWRGISDVSFFSFLYYHGSQLHRLKYIYSYA